MKLSYQPAEKNEDRKTKIKTIIVVVMTSGFVGHVIFQGLLFYFFVKVFNFLHF